MHKILLMNEWLHDFEFWWKLLQTVIEDLESGKVKATSSIYRCPLSCVVSFE